LCFQGQPEGTVKSYSMSNPSLTGAENKPSWLPITDSLILSCHLQNLMYNGIDLLLNSLGDSFLRIESAFYNILNAFVVMIAIKT
jgi:hypothetical protein